MKSIKMILLPALLLLWVAPLSNAEGRLRRFYLISNGLFLNKARNICISNYTDLVTIYNLEDDNAARNKCKEAFPKPCWIGLNSCSWSNSGLVTYVNFSSTFNVARCCGAVDTNTTWKCEDCDSTQMYFMCYKKDDNLQSFTYTLIREKKTWSEAQRYCRENHTDLVSIRNEEENDQVKQASKFSFPFWIGLQYNDSSRWFDGGQSHYTHNTKPNVFGCFTFLSFLVQKYWSKSNTDKNAAVCYKSLIHVSERNMSWEDAMDYCNDSGPLVIQSEDDQTETERELRRTNITGPVWVGLRQSRLFGFWIWTNGLHVGPWSNWTGGTAPEHQMSQHCGALVKVDDQYKLTDKDCRYHFRVLCETG